MKLRDVILFANRYLSYVLNACIIVAILAGIGFFTLGLFTMTKG
jgi:hypothetical protein